MVGPGRLELPTSRLSGVRSNHLSYRPDLKRVLISRRKRNEDGGIPLRLTMRPALQNASCVQVEPIWE